MRLLPRPARSNARSQYAENIVASTDWARAIEDGGHDETAAPAAGDGASLFVIDMGGAVRVRADAGRSDWVTPAFASVACLRGEPPAPADDAEALLAVMLWLATGQLPWCGAGLWVEADSSRAAPRAGGMARACRCMHVPGSGAGERGCGLMQPRPRAGNLVPVGLGPAIWATSGGTRDPPLPTPASGRTF
jgi:hypothetical protein